MSTPENADQKDVDRLIFQEHPNFVIGGCMFQNVPTILQFDDTPLISVVREANAGFTTEFPIFYTDGAYIAKVRGARIFPGPDAAKVDLKMRYPDKRTVCEMNGKTVFELERQGAAALAGSAELFTNTGVFLRVSKDELANSLLQPDGNEQQLQIRGIVLKGCRVGGRIGILIRSDGVTQIAVH